MASHVVDLPIDTSHEHPKPKGVDLGTTIIAAKFNGGVVLGADSRSSTGAYVANRYTDKLYPLTDNIYILRSGSSADTQAVADIVSYYLDFHRMEIEKWPAVKTASNLLQKISYSNKAYLMTSFIVAGVDDTGPRVFTIPLGSPVVEQPFAIGGSGSTYIYGYCDSAWRDNMTEDECVNFVSRAASLAMSRDGSSGGLIRLCILHNDGTSERRMLRGNEIPRHFENM
eukprot:gnl/Trimastix_PCT/1871.p1 GENE.gnl/Trimastix_PCT/1871~~gnl/Trimastix_PCT/1871.p1  ORF type:complete len:227 (+),score=41.28 gnl/Trimastix_PCT/1871:645-1325(+)